MTTPNEAADAIINRFLDNYTGVANSRIVLQNEDEDFKDNTVTPWIRLTILDQVRGQETMGKSGNRKYRGTGQLFVQVYTATDIGVKTGDDLAKEALDLFEGVSFSALDFNNGIARRSGPDGKWYQHVVEVDFDYEEIK